MGSSRSRSCELLLRLNQMASIDQSAKLADQPDAFSRLHRSQLFADYVRFLTMRFQSRAVLEYRSDLDL